MQKKNQRSVITIRDTRLDCGDDFIPKDTTLILRSGIEVDGDLLCQVTRSRVVAISAVDLAFI